MGHGRRSAPDGGDACVTDESVLRLVPVDDATIRGRRLGNGL